MTTEHKNELLKDVKDIIRDLQSGFPVGPLLFRLHAKIQATEVKERQIGHLVLNIESLTIGQNADGEAVKKAANVAFTEALIRAVQNFEGPV